MVEEVLARQRYLLMSGATERGPAGRRTSSKASNSPLVRSGRIAGDAHVYDDWVPHPLPSDFPWFTPMWDPQARLLRIEHGWGMEVAYVNMRADGATWLSVVNRHRGLGLRRYAVAHSCETATCWASCWAAARAERLRETAIEWERPKGKAVAFKRLEETREPGR